MSQPRPAIIDTSTAARLAVLTSAALVVAGVIQFLDTPSGETTVVGIEHVSLAAFTAVLVLASPVVHALGLPLSWIVTLLLAQVGGPLLAAAYRWLLGRRLRTAPLPLARAHAAGEPAMQGRA